MRKCIVLFSVVPLVLVLFCFLSPVQAQQGGWTGNANLFLGGKFLDENEWFPTENQFEYGVAFDIKMQNWPVSIAVDYLRGSGDGLFFIEFESETSEFDLGVRKIWTQYGNIKPFLGGGIAIIIGEFEGDGASDVDTGVGIWIGGGGYWTLYEYLNLGFELRYSYAEVTLFGVDVSAGGFHVGGLVGYHF